MRSKKCRDVIWIFGLCLVLGLITASANASEEIVGGVKVSETDSIEKS